MKANRTFLVIAGLAGILLAVIVGWSVTRDRSRGAAEESVGVAVVPNVNLVTARTGVFVEQVTVQGLVGSPAGSAAKLAFAQAGIVDSVDVHVGDTVEPGQTLARLDRSSLAAAVMQARAEARSAAAGYSRGEVPAAMIESARAKLDVATEKLATLERGGEAALSSQIAAQSAARQAALKVASDATTLARERTLFSGGVVASKNVDEARAQLESGRADERANDAKVSAAATDFAAVVKQARADVAAARSDLQAAESERGALAGSEASANGKLEAARIAFTNGVLTARSRGIVLAIAKHPGEFVDPTQSVMEVGPGRGRAVTLNVPADVARRIAIGDPATLEFAQSKIRHAHGRVSAVVPVVDPTTQLATVVVDGAPANAVSGDALTATIVVGRIRGVIVPMTAIVQDPQSGKTVVFVRQSHPKGGESGFKLRDVSVRASDTTTAAISTGLRAGERIAATGGYTLLAPSSGS